jgi:hypothetical protein
MTWMQLGVCILAVVRMSLLISYENSMQWLRDAAKAYQIDEAGHPIRPFAKFLTCFWCQALFWGFVLAPLAMSRFWLWLVPLAVSGGAILLLHASNVLRHVRS